MISEQQQEFASLYALGALPETDRPAFEAALLASPELRAFTRELQRAADLLAISHAKFAPPASLRDKILKQIDVGTTPKSVPPSPVLAGLRFLDSPSQSGWKELPIRGAYIKVLSLEKDRGYAVLLGKLDPGVRYPAHINAGPEDFFVLTGDLVIGERKMVAGDFHHADGGTPHAVNYSVEGCTLLAVLTTDDPLVAFAMA